MIERSDVVLSLVAEPVMQGFLERLNPNTRSLHDPLLDRGGQGGGI